MNGEARNRAPEVLVDGYLQRNFGDDLLFWLMCKLYPQVRFAIMKNGEYSDAIASPPNLDCVGQGFTRRRRVALRVLNKASYALGGPPDLLLQRRLAGKEFDAFLWLGGSLFVGRDRGVDERQLALRRRMMAAARGCGLMDSNFGPYSRQDYRDGNARLFSEFDFVSFREKHSADIFPELANVSYGADLVFALPAAGVGRVAHEGRRVFVVPIDLLLDRPGDMAACMDRYESALAEFADAQAEAGAEVTLMSFCSHEGDLYACQRVHSMVKHGGAVRIYEHRNIEKSMRELASADLIVGSRFHAIFFGAALGIPVLPLSYSTKIDYEFDDLGCPKRFPTIPEIAGPLSVGDESLLLPGDIDQQAAASWRRQTARFDELLQKLGFGELALDGGKRA